MPQLRRICELYSVHKGEFFLNISDDQGTDDQMSNLDLSPGRLRPGSILEETPKKVFKRDRNSGRSSERSSVINDSFNRFQASQRKSSVPRGSIVKRSLSTYQSQFSTSSGSKIRNRSYNQKTDFKRDQYSYSYKFPPIPRTRLEEAPGASILEAKLKEFKNLQKLSPSYKRVVMNKTTNKAIIRDKSKEKKFRLKLSKNKSILQKIADNSLGGDPLMLTKKPVSISEIMKPNYDRPKVSAVQDTLQGILQASTHLKGQQRHKKFKTWGGMKIPINSANNVFNKGKDMYGRWDEQRDGIFYKL